MAPDIPSLSAALDRIRAFARAMEWRPHKLATAAGVSEVTTRRLFESDWAPTSNTIRSLEAVIPSDWKAGDAAPEMTEAA